MSYDIGDRRRLGCTIADEDGSAADPDTLLWEIREPDGTITTYVYGTDIELVRDGTGEFHVYWDCAQSGSHRYRWAASGNIAVAEEGRFRVRRTVFVQPVAP